MTIKGFFTNFSFAELYKKLKSSKRKLQSDILFETLTILSVSIALIIGYTYYSNTHSIYGQAEEYMKKSIIYLEERVIKGLSEAERAVKLYTPLLADADLEKMAQNLPYFNSMMAVLDASPQITTVYFGTPGGYFWELSSARLMAPYFNSLGAKLPEGTTSVIKVINNKNTTQTNNQLVQEVNEEWVYIINNREFQGPRLGERTGYDHRKRQWYIDTSKTRVLQWSSIYVFASTLRGEAGITASQSVYDSQGQLKGVFGADISLKAFSNLLRESKVSANSASYIIDDKNRIIASSSLKSNVNIKDLEFNLMTVNDTDDAILKAGLKYYEQEKGKESFLKFSVDNIEYVIAINNFSQNLSNNWRAVIISPLDDFVLQIKQSRNNTLMYSLVILIVAFILAYRLAHRISRPIMQLAEEAHKIKELNLQGKLVIHSKIREICDLNDAITSLKTTMQSFSYYIPKALVRKLINRKQSVHIGGRAKDVTLMFTDIAGFTTVSETLSPDKLVVHLSEYFEEMTTIIMNNNGTVDKYIGDAIMAFWGAPIPDRIHTLNACRSALLCQQRLRDLNRVWKREDKPVFHTRVGLHVGNVVIGNIGSSERMNYTAIGDSVNLCSRLEAINKYYGTSILVSETVHEVVKDIFLMRIVDCVAVKGKAKAIKIYELVGQLKGDEKLYPTDEQVEFCADFEKAHKLYMTRQWQEALAAFEAIRPINNTDLSLNVYITRCHEFIENPPPKDWNGSHTMTEK